MPGPRPLPTAIKEASGTFKKNPKRRPAAEPEGTFDGPAIPDEIAEDPIALKRWHVVVQQLRIMEILEITDAASIEIHCSTYSAWKTTDHGLNAWHKLSDRLFKQLAEFGFTPSSRTKIQVPNKTNSTNPLQELKLRMGKTG